MADYFWNWLEMGERRDPPPIFLVNWFRKDAEGRYLWPGYRENFRVLKWVVERIHGRAAAVPSPLGWVPRACDLALKGLEGLAPERLAGVLAIRRERLPERFEAQRHRLLAAFGDE
jgi:phosphoenolpyruvate carboxykinase (GTP)